MAEQTFSLAPPSLQGFLADFGRLSWLPGRHPGSSAENLQTMKADMHLVVQRLLATTLLKSHLFAMKGCAEKLFGT